MPDRPVLYFTRFVPDYNVPALQLLNERIGGRLVVCAGDPPPGSSLSSLGSSAKAELPYFELRNTWVRGETLHWQPWGPAFEAYPSPSVVLAEESPRTVSLPLLLRRARSTGARTLLWGHFSSNRRAFDPARHPLDRYRVALARSVDGFVAYTDEVAQSVGQWIGPERVFVARNTLDTRVLFALDEALRAEGRAAVRSRLGLPVDEPVLVFIGRLVPEKGLSLLLETFERIRADHPAHLVVIGGGPGASLVAEAATRMGGVTATGPLASLDASAPWLFASDLALLPGYLGLSVNHALAFGLPVVSISTALDTVPHRSGSESAGARFHSPEVGYIRPGENGLLADPNAGALAQAVESVLAARDRFSEAARAYARDHLSIERMVDGLEAAIAYAEGSR